MQPPSMPPTDKNDPVLTYDPINRVVLAIVKVTTGEEDDAKHELQTWAYDAGANTWQRMNPAAEPEPSGNRARNLMFAPVLNLAILENCTSRPREQQVWTYRYDATTHQLTEILTPTVGRAALSTTFTYDASGNLVSSTDARNNTATYGYDRHGNRTLERDALGIPL
jgi:YD repeat-containing protein